MLTEFHVRNFVLIEDGSLVFDVGLNVISGETGAGKSLVATALGIALGRDRFETRHLRRGTDGATLTAVFSLPKKRLRQLGRKLELDLAGAEEDGLVLERTQTPEGRGRIRINGQPAPLTTLRALGEYLVDISAQDEHTALRDEGYQRELLDTRAGLLKDAAACAELHRRLTELVARLEGGEAARRERQQELERIAHQRGELEALAPDTQTDAALEMRIAFLENASRLRTFCADGVERLYEEDGAAASRLGVVVEEGEELADCAPEVADVLAAAQEAGALIDDIVRQLRELGQRTDVDETELEEVIERRHDLRDAARLHDCDVSELADILEKLRQREEELIGWETDEAGLVPAIEEAAAAFRMAGVALRVSRKRRGRTLAKEVKGHLARLGMEQADFAVELLPLCADEDDARALARDASPTGLDAVAFNLKANPGEAWGSIAKTASGGEATRALLAVKCALSKAQNRDVLFFDEIDAGVGGRLGEEIALQLKALSADRQVVVITHMPQIASHGATHMVVRKATARGRTTTTVGTLDGEERVAEIASMIRGERSTETTLEQAREMLGTA